jgi:hypothetical protein
MDPVKSPSDPLPMTAVYPAVETVAGVGEADASTLPSS